jgi:hypothetical protein
VMPVMTTSPRPRTVAPHSCASCANGWATARRGRGERIATAGEWAVVADSSMEADLSMEAEWSMEAMVLEITESVTWG